MSYLSIKLTYDYISKNAKIKWKDINYGINNDLITTDVAIEHALKIILQTETYNENILSLAMCNSGESTKPFIDQLIEEEALYDEQHMVEKWNNYLKSQRSRLSVE